MFTEKEIQLLVEWVSRARDAEDENAPLAREILEKLARFKDYTVTMRCHSCLEELDWSEFSGVHLCRGCGKPICDICYDEQGALCVNCAYLGQLRVELYEAADVLRDLAMDR